MSLLLTPKARLYFSVILNTALFTVTSETCNLSAADWPQWGGPNRNFMINSQKLADSWPSAGPRQFWKRELGDGYSGIAVEGHRLYTMVHRNGQEVVMALDADSGKTIWEYAYEVTFLKDMNIDKGPGPHATPLIAGPRVFTTGSTGRLHCLDKQSGKAIWSHDLYKEFNGTVMVRGYSSSPLAYRDTVIVPVGGPGCGLMAFKQADGSGVWKNQDFNNSHSSPILIDFEGQDQLIALMHKVIAGIDPKNGDLLWNVPHEVIGDHIVFTPLWSEGNLLFYSSAYNGGSRLLKLSKRNGQMVAEELWFSNKMRVHHGNAIRIGENIYGSSGDFGPAFLTAMDIRTGKVLWQDRSFPKCMLIYSDGKFIILDEDGNLSLASLDSQGLKIFSKVELLSSKAWTPPSLVGTRLYVRDRKTLLALDLK